MRQVGPKYSKTLSLCLMQSIYRSCLMVIQAMGISIMSDAWLKKLEQRDIAAVCIEDKLYPKTNSFIDGDKQELADIDEFCSRIKAGKDAQIDDDFSIITRVEAFIAGWGLSEALRRAEAYHRAGSDAILIHSAKSDPSEILAFKEGMGRYFTCYCGSNKILFNPNSGIR